MSQLERIFELIKKASVKDGDSEELFASMKLSIIEACNYWITLSEEKPKHEEEVFAIGFTSFSDVITCRVAKYDGQRDAFIENGDDFRVLGWRPLPKMKFVSVNN